MIKLLQKIFAKETRKKLVQATRWPPVGSVHWGDLRRGKPVSDKWGGDRGTPVDRYYIEKFLEENGGRIRGKVLEIGNDRYSKMYGAGKTKEIKILHASGNNPKADYIASLENAPQIPDDYFDCVICTQTLQLIPDLEAAIKTIHRILVPGGAALVTLPGISRIYSEKTEDWKDFWRFTEHSAALHFKKIFSPSKLKIRTRGNVLASAAFLYGIAREELKAEELDHNDPLYQLVILISAEK